MTARPELAIFDLDGVLAGFDAMLRTRLLADAAGVTPEAVERRIYRSGFEQAAEAGAHPTGDGYLAALNRRLGTSLTRSAWTGARRRAMEVDRAVLDLVAALETECTVVMLTNNGSLLLEELPSLVPAVAEQFGSRAHASFQFGARKPDAEVFERLLARYHTPVERAVFVDDDPTNVLGARRAGLHAHLHTSAADTGPALSALGLRCR